MTIRDRRNKGGKDDACSATVSAVDNVDVDGNSSDGDGDGDGDGAEFQKYPTQHNAAMRLPKLILVGLSVILCFALLQIRTIRPNAVLIEERRETVALVNTAVVVRSSWDPSHPSIEKIQNAIQSIFQYLIGLDEASPIFVTVDDQHIHDLSNEINNNSNYHSNSNFHIVGLTKILETIHQQYPSVKYMYHVDEDLIFSVPVDHRGLLRTLEDPFEYVTTDINYVLFVQGISEATWVVRQSCLSQHTKTNKRNARRVPVRKSQTANVVKDMIVSSGLGAKDGLAFLCESCDYRPTKNTYLVRFDWYHMLVKTLKTRRGDDSDNNFLDVSFPRENMLVSEVNNHCKLHEKQNETSGLYMYFDTRLNFGKNVLGSNKGKE